MALNTPNSALPYPELTDIPNAQTAFQNLALALDTKVVPKFATPVARDAAIPSPVDGQVCYMTDRKGYLTYKTSWQPLGTIVCTSSTRPTPAEVGREIYETDTERKMVYNGSAWTSLTPYRRQQILTSTAASVTFSSIPTSLRTLEVKWRGRCDAAVTGQVTCLRVNNNSTANYYGNYAQLANATHSPGVHNAGTFGRMGICLGASGGAGAGFFGVGTVRINGWNGLSKVNYTYDNGTYDTSTSCWSETGHMLFNVAGPYTSLVLFPATGNWVSGCEFYLEGWE